MPIDRPMVQHRILQDKNIIFLDTEFFNTNSKAVTPVCASPIYHNRMLNGQPLQHTAPKVWTYGEEGRAARALLATTIESLCTRHGYVIAAFSVEAECRFLHSIGVDYTRLKYIDLWVEYQMLANKSNEIAYGRQLIRGRVKFTKPPPRKSRFSDEEPEDTGDNSKHETNLAAAQFKLLKKQRDTEHKKDMRNLIIGGGPFSEEDKNAILDYCYEDTEDLPAILSSILYKYERRYSKRDFANVWEEMLERGDYAQRSAQMVILGYPVDLAKVENLQNNIPDIKRELALDVNRILQESIGIKIFEYNKKTITFSKKMKTISDALLAEYPDWPTSEKTGKASISDEVLSKYSSARHEYKPTLVDQLVRVQKTESALRGFEQYRAAGKRGFKDYLGPDGRVRPHFGIYRAQSSRSQPQAVGFLFLKSAWVRTLVMPPLGSYIGDIDFSAEEWIIAAVLSGDSAMLADYLTGDPYISFGIRAGILPKTATKQSHWQERVWLKSGALGRIYGLGVAGLQIKLEYDTDRPWEYEESKQIVDAFNETYDQYFEYRTQLVEDYKNIGYLRLCDGWTMWGDNDNPLSVQNCPIQGTGAVVMRQAVRNCQDAGVRVIKTLHDALYHEGYLRDGLQELNVMVKAMQQAWHQTMARCGFDSVPDIRMEGNAWGRGLNTERILLEDGKTPCDTMPVFYDARGVEDYKLYKKYLDTSIAVDFEW